MLDIHCHIVPFTDDGARDVDTTLAMAREAVKCGYTGIFATSHYIIHDIENDNEEFRKNVEKLNELYKENGIDLTVYPANEIFFTNDMLGLIENKKVCTLADTKYVLFELPLFTKIIPMNVYDELNALQDKGYVPILAHPERYDFVQEDVDTLIPLIEAGVLLQSNLASINKKYGRKVAKTVKKMYKRDMVHFIGTDSHTTSVYMMYDECIKKIKKAIKNDERFEQIIANSNTVLENGKINIWYPKDK